MWTVWSKQSNGICSLVFLVQWTCHPGTVFCADFN
jgi:hypothetical protein